MNQYIAYQFRGHVRKNDHERLDQAVEECRKLYNKFRWERKEAYKQYGIKIYGADQDRRFTKFRNSNEFWGSVSVHIGRGVIDRVSLAYEGFFQRNQNGETPGYPRYKPQSQYKTIDFNVVKSMLILPINKRKIYIKVKGLPVIEIRLKREIPNVRYLKTIRITRKPTGWYITLSFAFISEPMYPNDKKVGIDMGVNNRLALSDGNIIEGRTPDRERENKLRKQLDHRTKKDSKGRWLEKQSKRQIKTQKTLSRETYRNKIRNRNTCHRITTHLIRTYEYIGIEDLKINNLVRSNKGTIENPGKNVSAKRSLNRRILDQTWGLIGSQLDYKAAWAGSVLERVPPHYTSRTCSVCGKISKQEEYRIYFCPECDTVLDRDINAARNIKIKAFGTRVGSPLEPLEVVTAALQILRI